MHSKLVSYIYKQIYALYALVYRHRTVYSDKIYKLAGNILIAITLVLCMHFGSSYCTEQLFEYFFYLVIVLQVMLVLKVIEVLPGVSCSSLLSCFLRE